MINRLNNVITLIFFFAIFAMLGIKASYQDKPTYSGTQPYVESRK